MASKKKLYYYYYLVIDLEGSSSQNIPLDIQIEKLEKLRLCVNKILNPKSKRLQHPQKKIRYINSTGDGYFIIFDIGEDALKFSIDLHKYLNLHNRKIRSNKIYTQRKLTQKQL